MKKNCLSQNYDKTSNNWEVNYNLILFQVDSFGKGAKIEINSLETGCMNSNFLA